MTNAFKGALAAAAMTVLGGFGAHAVPTFTNPNFTAAVTPTATYAYYNYNGTTDSWLSTNAAGSYSGYAAAYQNAFWDNGVAPNSVTNVAFLQEPGAKIQEIVSGFVIGHSYTISVAADSRANTYSGNVKLDIQVNGTSLGATSPTTVGKADPFGVFATPWGTYTSQTFVAAATTATIAFMNNGSNTFETDIDLTNAQIQDVTAVQNPVPEPASFALLIAGIAGVAVARRRSRLV